MNAGWSLLVLAAAMPVLGAAPPNEPNGLSEVDLHLRPGQLELDPSFVTCSYYFRPPAAVRGLEVEYRGRGEPEWKTAMPPVSDLPPGIWKGSLFGLGEDADWQVRIRGGDGGTVAQGEFHTWSSHPPIAKVVDLSRVPRADDAGVVISDQGTPQGWIEYVVPPGWVLRHPYNPKDPLLAAITFRHARNVILANATVVGGERYGILVQESDSVRIENCEVSGWGRVGVQQFTNTGTRGKYLDAKGELINLDGGIEIDHSARTVVERCYVHDPRGRTNSWMFSHPAGPEAMHVNYARGGTVLRWNDFIGSDEHRWNDAIESSANWSIVGGFYRDSDITGNYQAFGEDDGIELEGGGMNVRFYGNKVEGTMCGVSTGACVLGPQYVIGNLIANPGDESGLALYFFKNSYPEPNDGRRFFVNNTLYGFTGTAYGSYGAKRLVRRGFMRNNVFLCGSSRPPGPWARVDDFDHDWYWVKADADQSRRFLAAFRAQGQEAHAVAADPHLADPDEGDFRLGADSGAHGQAVAVPGICPAGADLGAFAKFDELPYRPLALLARPRQLKFTTPHENPSRKVVLSWPASERQALAFRIRKNDAFDWFTVRPAEGKVEPGQTLTLTVAVDPARLTGRRLFKGAFLVRTANGLSRPVTVYATGDFTEDLRPAAAPDTVYLEAAQAPDVAGRVRTTDAAGVAGGRYVALRSGGGQPGLDFTFDVPRAGAYSVLLRTSIEDDVTKKHRFDLAWDAGSQAIGLATDFQWNAEIDHQRFRPVYLYSLGKVAAGRHRLRLTETQGGLDVNEIIVTDNPGVFFDQYWQRSRD